MRITNDEGYHKALEWLVERSKTIANPLVKEEAKTAHRRLYDVVEGEIIQYRHSCAEEQPKTALDDWLD